MPGMRPVSAQESGLPLAETKVSRTAGSRSATLGPLISCARIRYDNLLFMMNEGLDIVMADQTQAF